MTKTTRPAKRFTQSKVESVQRVLPPHTNQLHTLYGGRLLSWMDEVASISAERYCEGPAMTAGIEALSFVHPVPMGSVLILTGAVYAVGRTSMEIFIRACVQDVRKQTKRLTTSGFFTFVAIDTDLKPRAVPDLIFDARSGMDRDIRRRALARKRLRKHIAASPLSGNP